MLALVAACTGRAETVTSTVPSPATGATTTSAPITTTSGPSTTVTTLADLEGRAYEVVAAGAAYPMIVVPWTDDRSLVALRDGRVFAFDGEALSPEPLFDLDVSTDGERGLLGLAVMPDAPDQLLVHYSDLVGDRVVSEVSAASGVERVLLTVDQPASNHNGVMLQFGPDGAMFLGLGDGGGAGDRYGNARNRDTLLGGIVRIDPDSGES